MSNSEAETKRFAEPIYLRLEPDTLGDVTAHLAVMKKKTPALTITQADALRDLIIRGLRDAQRAR